MSRNHMKNEFDEVRVKKAVKDMLSIDRYVLLRKFPFLGSLAMRFELVPVRDIRCSTACTDGKTVYVDCDFYSSLPESERLFVFSHEIFHNMLFHFTRRQMRDPNLFNIATDMEVNHLLMSTESNSCGISMPPEVLYPPKNLEGKSAEVIYDALSKKRKSKSGDGDESDSSRSTDSSKSSSGSHSSTSKGKSNVKGQFDKHEYNDDSDCLDDNLGRSDKWGEVGLDDDFKPSASAADVEKIREAIISAAQYHEKTMGRLPSGLEHTLSKIKRPTISWRELLCDFITKCYSGEMTYLPPNRRHVHADMYFQSRRSDRIKIAVCIDTSGSCVDELPQFFGELKGLVESFGSYEIDLYMADADISHHAVYDESNPLDIDCTSGIKWSGGGGTSFVPFFDALAKQEEPVNCAVYLTDGYGEAPSQPPPYPTLWVITKSGITDFCSWGEKIKLTESAYDY